MAVNQFFRTLHYNIGCTKGHRFYTPNPEAWRGRECLHKTGEGQSCDAKLRRLRVK